MGLTFNKTNLKTLHSALQVKRVVGSLSQERKEIRKLLNELKKNEVVDLNLPDSEYKTYKSSNKKINRVHPLLDKIRLEVKHFNKMNKDDNNQYIVIYKKENTVFIALHNYSDIKSAITKSKNGSERINFNNYNDVISTLVQQ